MIHFFISSTWRRPCVWLWLCWVLNDVGFLFHPVGWDATWWRRKHHLIPSFRIHSACLGGLQNGQLMISCCHHGSDIFQPPNTIFGHKLLMLTLMVVRAAWWGWSKAKAEFRALPHSVATAQAYCLDLSTNNGSGWLRLVAKQLSLCHLVVAVWTMMIYGLW